MADNQTIVITGANGVVGYPLQRKIQQSLAHEKDQRCVVVSRNKIVSQAYCAQRVQSIQWDMRQPISDRAKASVSRVNTVIHCAPIWLLPDHLPDLKALGLTRIIAFSSSSVLSKTNSNNRQELQLVNQLANAEQQISEFSTRHGINTTILRPSLIYGYGRDQNVTKLARFIDRFGFMLLVGQASGLRQPVHADDLVETCCKILDNAKTFGKTYNLGGGETLTYRAMLERIFIALDKQPRFIKLPLGVFRVILSWAAKLTTFAYTPEMADRMNQDLNYDYQAANTDFGYAPKKFLADSQRDLHIDQQTR